MAFQVLKEKSATVQKLLDEYVMNDGLPEWID
jgi:hypothetical protein